MSAYEWFRIRRTMLAYDYWLDVEGVTGRARKDLRAELVGNLTDATAAVGYPAARRSLGSVRTLATAAAPDRDSRPRWVVGSYAAIVVFAIGAFAALGLITAWADGVMAALCRVSRSRRSRIWRLATRQSSPTPAAQVR